MARNDERYLVRSQRRASYNRAPRKRNRREGHGIIYGIFSLLVSAVLWPAGMAMLWRRKLNWSVGVKMISSLLTLILCLCWMGFALTVQTGDPRITYAQDRVNTFLGNSVQTVSQKLEKTGENLTAFGQEMGIFAGRELPQAAEKVNSLAQGARDLTRPAEGKTTPEPEITAEAAITAEATAAAEITAAPTEAPEVTAPPEETVQPEQSAQPEETAAVQGNTPAPGQVTAVPAQVDIPNDPTPAPTVKPAGEATVYHSSNGRFYHMASTCKGMSSAEAYTLAESVNAGFKACGTCDAPDEKFVTENIPNIWVDENDVCHTSDECEGFAGQWRLMALADAAEQNLAGCSLCGGDAYVNVSAEITPAPTEEATAEPTIEPTEEATAEPTMEPTEEPTAEPTEEATAEPTTEPTEVPAETAQATEGPVTLKDPGEATVYHCKSGVGYHMASSCVNMQGASPDTLRASVEAGYRACRACGSPDASILQAQEPVLWIDENEICHISDECAAFQGQWRLMTASEAAEKGYAACAECGAAEYLPQTQATEEPTLEPTQEPTPEPVQEPAGPVTLKAPGEATVYYCEGGVGYHMAESCVQMRGASPHSLAEAVEAGYRACGNCHAPDASILQAQEPVLWIDENEICHVSDECAAFNGQWRLMTASEAVEKGYAACPECGAAEYLPKEAPTPEPTEEPTPEPTLEPTPNPWVVDGVVLAKPASAAVVYHTENGKAYHMAETCVGMTGASPCTLENAVSEGYVACGNCGAPAAELLEADVVWADENEICHISDDCASFQGSYRLLSKKDALAQGLSGCPDCGGDGALTEYAAQEQQRQQLLMEKAKTVTVYYNDNSRYYHAGSTCVNMSSADPHTLYDALEKGLKRCGRCQPPVLSDLEGGE